MTPEYLKFLFPLTLSLKGIDGKMLITPPQICEVATVEEALQKTNTYRNKYSCLTCETFQSILKKGGTQVAYVSYNGKHILDNDGDTII